ncbi:MAG: type 2 isopentenyl-diphosphate Delta-isomerase [Chloroflexi bacterium]|nr:MAG: type 2 isopentenyl-diphosphate Delta-isomerase [Chloroflexota bacterium]
MDGHLSDDTTETRKVDHLRIVLEEDVAAKGVSSGWARYRFRHCALPDIDLRDIDTSIAFLGKRLSAPLLISSMTGGAAEAERINLLLAEAAETLGVAMGVGSQRAALRNPALARTYRVRKVAPTAVLLANLGAVQLNYGYGVSECRQAVEMIEADALILHLNPLQEAVQPEGNTNFKGLLPKIEAVCREVEVPVIVKEVGNGISAEVARRLVDVGVAAIDVAGAGGTSWSEVERYRHTVAQGRTTAAVFAGWGIPTTQAIQEVRAALPHTLLIGSGGVRTGLDVAKAIALGADLVGSAAPHLFRAADDRGLQAIFDGLRGFQEELRITMFLVGAADLPALRRAPLEFV